MTLTTEKLNEIYENPEQCSYSEIQEMAAMLANREAQPVAWIVEGDGAPKHLTPDREYAYMYPERTITPLYTAPPAPAVNVAPDFEAWFVEKYKQPERLVKNEDGTYRFSGVQMAFSAWNACRAAMLAKPVSSGHKLADGWIACSERMPVDTQTVLCSNLLTELSGIPFIADYVGEFQLYDGTKYESGFYINRELQTVTHWMPLPAAPEGGNG